MLATLIVNLWSKKKRKFKDFLPPWYDTRPKGDPLEGFKQLMEMAEANAHNQHPER